MKKLLLVLILVSAYACKNDKKKAETNIDLHEEVVTKEKTEIGLQVTVNTILPEDDVVILRYTESEDLKFKPKEFVKVKVKGSDLPQDLIFILPDKIMPTRMMLFYGKKNKTGMALNSIRFKMNDRSFDVLGNNVWQFLYPNKFIDFNKENNSFVGKEIEGHYSPAFSLRRILIQRLEEKIF